MTENDLMLDVFRTLIWTFEFMNLSFVWNLLKFYFLRLELSVF